jgi:hypothetical protein
MSTLFAKRKLVFKPTEQFEVKFKGFIHLLDNFSVKRGEWLEVEDR